MALRLILTFALFLFGDLYERNSLRNLSAIRGNLSVVTRQYWEKRHFDGKFFLTGLAFF